MADLLRIRLRFKNFRNKVAEDCWFLLDPDTYRQVSDFLKNIQAKFQIGPIPLRCSTKGFLLPPNEDIAIIRDEDEIVIEEEDVENAASAQDGVAELNEVVQRVENNHPNLTAHSGDGSQLKRKTEEGSTSNLASKKRKRDESTKKNNAITVGLTAANLDGSTELSTKKRTLKKKRKSKTREVEEVEKASKDKMNSDQSLSILKCFCFFSVNFSY